jgi:RNA polymerase sigma factor (sigma-70 family)
MAAAMVQSRSESAQASKPGSTEPAPEPALEKGAELWERARSGDPKARERLAGLAHALADHELRRRGAPSGELADLSQETVRSSLSFLVSPRAVQTPRDLRAFLKFRAWGVLSDHRKKMRAMTTRLAGSDGSETASRDWGPEDRLRAQQLRRALADCRRSLSEETRAVLELRYEGGLETDGITSRLGVHRNTVHVRVFRALAQLRECLRRKGFDAGDLA